MVKAYQIHLVLTPRGVKLFAMFRPGLHGDLGPSLSELHLHFHGQILHDCRVDEL